MKKKVIIGIDFSKLTIDVSFFHKERPEDVNYRQFKNTEEGCMSMIKWIAQKFKNKEEWLFCGEYTGIYSMTTAYTLNEHSLDLWLETPLQIKLSSGICREKNDKVDSYQIAMYASRFTDRAKLYKLSSPTLLKIKELVAFKDRLTKIKHQLLTPTKELMRVWPDWNEAQYIDSASKELVASVNMQIKEIERKMISLLKTEPELKLLYKLITSVTGVGMQTAIYLIVHTTGFTTFSKSRELACYCGVAPFSKKSGTSLNGSSKISNIANKKLKTLLHMCALNAVRYDEGLKIYYERKIKEGKHKMKVLNNVRNKLIQRIWAVITKQETYSPNYINKLAA